MAMHECREIAKATPQPREKCGTASTAKSFAYVVENIWRHFVWKMYGAYKLLELGFNKRDKYPFKLCSKVPLTTF